MLLLLPPLLVLMDVMLWHGMDVIVVRAHGRDAVAWHDWTSLELMLADERIAIIDRSINFSLKNSADTIRAYQVDPSVKRMSIPHVSILPAVGFGLPFRIESFLTALNKLTSSQGFEWNGPTFVFPAAYVLIIVLVTELPVSGRHRSRADSSSSKKKQKVPSRE